MQNKEQEVFDQVVTHLLNQGERSVDADGSCAYRGIDGLKCAVGCLISDEDYNDSMEGIIVFDLGWVRPCNESLLGYLQEMHDKVSPSLWEIHLQDIADTWGLNYNG